MSVETAGTGLFIGGSGIAILAFVPFLIAERTIETNQMNATGSPIENQVDVEDARTLHALTASITIGGISIAGIGFILWLTGAIFPSGNYSGRRSARGSGSGSGSAGRKIK